MKKIVLAFDSFKNCLPSPELCRIAKSAIAEILPDCEIVCLPLGDGGEGTASAVTAACGGTMQKISVHGPLNRTVDAAWGLLPDNSAIFEMATASGIELISAQERNPMLTTTYGTGELLRSIVCEHHIKNITIGIGGSATVDGGIGMLQALGVEFFDADGNRLPSPATGNDISKISRIDVSGIPKEFSDVSIRIASDVNNPLCGETGAAKVFAPQKGADEQMVNMLEQNLKNFSELSVASKLADCNSHPGDGAAGGLGFALRNYLKAVSTSGAELVLELLGFDNIIKDADLIITGEGCSDFQTAHGKLPAIVANHARIGNIPVILLSGALGKDAEKLENLFDAVFSLSSAPCSLEQAIHDTEKNLKRMSKAIVKTIKIHRGSK